MIFVTIGSFAPFDRMVSAVDALAASHPEHEWFAQIGDGGYLPAHMQYERYIDKSDFDHRLETCDVLICHAGMGTMASAIAAQKPLLVFPRDHRRGEHVDDHQMANADLWEENGHILVVREADEVARVWPDVASFVPKPRLSSADAVAARVGAFLTEVSEGNQNRRRRPAGLDVVRRLKRG